MSTLLEIGSDLTALMDLLDESGGEVTPENEAAIEAWFAEIGLNEGEKLDNYCALIRHWELRAACHQEEAERHEKHALTNANNAKRLKDRAQFYMELTSQKKIETKRFRLTLCGNGGKQPLDITCPPENLPEGLTRLIMEPNREAIRALVENGVPIPGVLLRPRGTHLRIT